MNHGVLNFVREGVIAFLKARQTIGKPFGHFNQCANAFSPDELSALGAALELWKMLQLPLSKHDLGYAIARMADMQVPESGLIDDPTWEGRKTQERFDEIGKGDSFFTRTAICAAWAWGCDLPLPVRYPSLETKESLLPKVLWQRGGHHPWSIGDLVVILRHNSQLKLPGADLLYSSLCKATKHKQNMKTGLWQAPESALTPSINLSFHTIKFTINVFNESIHFPHQIIDSCLSACRDPEFYSWESGYACNDLDIAHVVYTATRSCSHRIDEVRSWARDQIPMILSIQKPDGGFSFYHDRAMDYHYLLKVSPGMAEGDLWGTLMYMGTLRMLVNLGYPELTVPWQFSEVHKVPQSKKNRILANHRIPSHNLFCRRN